MRHRLVSAFSTILAACGMASAPLPAFADNSANDSKVQDTVIVQKPRYRWLGVDVGAGFPSGGSLGLVLRPIYFARFELAGTYNGISPGLLGGLTIDPIPFAISPSFTVQGGATFSGQVPFASNPPSVEYKYLDLLAGLEMGNWKVWRLYVRGGFSWIDMQTHDFNNVINNQDTSLTVGDPRAVGWFPAVKVGLTYLF